MHPITDRSMTVAALFLAALTAQASTGRGRAQGVWPRDAGRVTRRWPWADCASIRATRCCVLVRLSSVGLVCYPSLTFFADVSIFLSGPVFFPELRVEGGLALLKVSFFPSSPSRSEITAGIGQAAVSLPAGANTIATATGSGFSGS